MIQTVDLGTNIITNCDAVLIVDGVEIFRLRERSSDGQLVADFEIRNNQNEILVRVSENNVIYAQLEIFEARHGVGFSEVRNRDTGEILGRVEKISNNAIKVVGTFFVNGNKIKLTERMMDVNGNKMMGNRISGAKRAIVISGGNISVG